MTHEPQRPDDFDPDLWEFLGRHRAAEPSVGFADRTLRRLHEPPPRRWGVWRWALAGAAAAVLVVAAVWQQHAERVRRAEFYAATHQADYLEDFDVIEVLHLVKGENHL
jgi:hypothetical protein